MIVVTMITELITLMIMVEIIVMRMLVIMTDHNWVLLLLQQQLRMKRLTNHNGHPWRQWW